MITATVRDSVGRMRHDVAIYTTSSATAGHYDRSHGRAGGAERQMTLLARALTERGRKVAHIIYPPREPVALSYPLTLIHRPPYSGRRRLGGALEALAVWQALGRADARAYVLRSASPAVGVAAVFCKLRRRRLVFSSSNVSDFQTELMASRWNRKLYRIGVRLADAVVIQSEDQRALALHAFPSLRRVVQIPSLVEATPLHGAGPCTRSDFFLWFGRSVPQKQPLQYVELARAIPEARFAMVPVPDGQDQRLLEAVRAAGHETPNLEVLDPVPHAQLTELIARSAAVVNTSTHEGMPNAFLEAWSRGVPVLTLEFDPDDVVARQGLGIAAGGSWDGFVAGAYKLWSSRSDRDEIADHVRAHVADVHSADAVAARWDLLIDDLHA
jgi:glycosyltransferase involved in cell wall biosynthesis